MRDKKKWFSVKLITTAIVTQYHVVIAEDETEAEEKARAMAPDDTWHYSCADYENIDAEVIPQD